MKINKTISTLAIGLGLASVAQAATPTAYFITGSTAFRNQVYNALGGELGLTASAGSSASKNSFTFLGTIANSKGLGSTNSSGTNTFVTGAYVEIFCNFSGSAEGVGAVVSNQAGVYLNMDGTTTTNHNGDDFAFSDVAQASTPASAAITGTTLPEVQLATDSSFAPFTGIAVQPFAFAVDKTAATAGIANITTFNFQDLFRVGTLDEAFFVGGIPQGTKVYAVGRYNLSGTRITAILDDNDSTLDGLNQYALSPDGSSTPGLHNGDSATPAGNQWVSVSNDGYFTGGNVGAALAGASVSNAPAAIGYIGFADAQAKFGTTGAVPIKWNGQNPGSLGAWNINGLENGSYTFFTYERLYEYPSDHGTAADAFGQDLVLGIQYEIISNNGGVQTADLEANMNVYRNTDGGDVVTY